MSRVNHINLSVSNIQKSVEFYNKIMFALGFTKGIHESGDWGEVVGYKGDNIEIEIIHERDKQYKPFNRFVGLNHIALQAKSKKHVDELYEIVKNLDVKITRKPINYPEYTENYYAFFFRDPDGIPLEIVYL